MPGVIQRTFLFCDAFRPPACSIATRLQGMQRAQKGEGRDTTSFFSSIAVSQHVLVLFVCHGLIYPMYLRPNVPNSALRMFEFEGDGDDMGMEGEIDIEGKGEQGYTDVSVREAVEWTMSKDTEFTYIDVRSAEEHEKLATVRHVSAPYHAARNKPDT